MSVSNKTCPHVWVIFLGICQSLPKNIVALLSDQREASDGCLPRSQCILIFPATACVFIKVSARVGALVQLLEDIYGEKRRAKKCVCVPLASLFLLKKWKTNGKWNTVNVFYINWQQRAQLQAYSWWKIFKFDIKTSTDRGNILSTNVKN